MPWGSRRIRLTAALAFALGALLAPHTASGSASASHYLKVKPAAVHAGETVTLYGSVDGGCAPGDQVTIYSRAFRGATHREFAGVPAVFAKVRKNHRFSRKIELARKLKPGRYQVGGRCGGGNFGSAELRVRRST